MNLHRIEDIYPMGIFGERCHDMQRSQEEITCPFCGAISAKVKVNGNGYYRCKGACRREFFLVWIEHEPLKDREKGL